MIFREHRIVREYDCVLVVTRSQAERSPAVQKTLERGGRTEDPGSLPSRSDPLEKNLTRDETLSL